jgi:hypothetical protein
MPKPLLKSSTVTAGMNWAALARLLAVQVAVLLVLAAAAITCIDWSSDAAVAEFMRAGQPSPPDPPQFSQPRQLASSSPRQCDRRKPL